MRRLLGFVIDDAGADAALVLLALTILATGVVP